MNGLVRVRVDRLLWAVVVLALVSVVNLGLSVLGTFQQGDIIRGQKLIEERVTPLCLSDETVDSCRRQIDAAKRSVVVRLCRIVHERLRLPRAECENALAAVIQRNAAASAHGDSRTARGPPSQGATDPDLTGVGSIPGGPEEAGPPPPPGKGTPPPTAEAQPGGGSPSGGGAAGSGSAGAGVEAGAGGAHVGVEAGAGGAHVGIEVEVPPILEVPPLIPKAVQGAGAAVQEVTGKVRSDLEGALGQ